MCKQIEKTNIPWQIGDFIKIRNTTNTKEINYVYITFIDTAMFGYFIKGEILFSSNPEKELTYFQDFTKPGDIIYKVNEKDFLENKEITQENFELRRKLILLKNS